MSDDDWVDIDEPMPEGWVPSESDKNACLYEIQLTRQEDDWQTSRICQQTIAANTEVIVQYWESTGLTYQAAQAAAALEIAALPPPTE